MLHFALALSTLVASAVAHGGLPINPDLGVPGFPDCVQTVSRDRFATTEGLEFTLECSQKPREFEEQIAIACVGDSITAGAHSSGGDHPYPQQLGLMLGSNYSVTNLGACGSTMTKAGNSPYWQRPQYKALIAGTWDIVTIMLGTNDAKDPGDGGPNNWSHDCFGADALTCPFSKDFADMINVVRGLGRTKGVAPKIFLAIPPPLMLNGVYGMNQTVINDVFPVLIPMINKANDIPTTPIDIFDAMGGMDQGAFPTGGCTLSTPNAADCKYYCDAQSCDQCHPNDNGYTHVAAAFKAGLGL